MGENGFEEYIDGLINNNFYVAPDTEIIILSGVPLDNTYEHTIVWDKLDPLRTKQKNYFLSKTVYNLGRNTYQRIDREWIKVNLNAEYLYDCNYLMIRNTAFNETKWWYAFITDVEYINNNTSKIRYEIDVMQSWLPGKGMDYEIMPCFVERCHSYSDKLYENVVPESIVNYNEYVVDEEQEFDMNNMSVIALATEVYDGDDILGNPTFKPVEGSVHYGTYGAVAVSSWNITKSNGQVNNAELSKLKKYLNTYINGGKENSIVSLQMFPTVLAPKEYFISGDVSDVPAIPENSTYIKKINKPSVTQKLGGKNSNFVPNNAKLYSYPFNLIKVNNECGCTRIYKWELFDDDTRGEFVITGTHIWSPSAIIYPSKYRGIEKNMEDSVTFNSFPVCPWSSDAYRAWWAQNAGNMAVTALGGIASLTGAVVGGITANPMLLATGVGGTVSSAEKIGTSLYEAKHIPSAEHGSNDTSLILPAIKNTKFVITKESLRLEMLKIYDDYFTKYGYAQKKIMVPPLRNRRRWTYVQTIGFEFTGKINDTDTKKIKSIFDNGITFWYYPNDIGHYEKDNIPLANLPLIDPI